MRILALAVLVASFSPSVIHAESDVPGAFGVATGYAGVVIRDQAGSVGNNIQDMTRAIAVPLKENANSFWGFLSDVGNGFEKSRAISNGDAVSINANVYSLSLRQAEKENLPLKTLQKDRDQRQYDLARAQEETKRLSSLAKDYKNIAGEAQTNISSALVGIAESAKKLEGWDKEKQAKLDKFVEEHKKLGSLTAEDGKPRFGDHNLVALNETWAELVNFIKKSPEALKSTGLEAKLAAMSLTLEGSTKRITDKENQMMAATAKINELSKFDEGKIANEEEAMKRQMILGTLNNSVNNLITNAEFSKVRSQLAFAHFKDIEKEIGDKKGLKAGDVKDQYKKNASVLASQYNNTPFGVYVNNQIAKAMGSVCELVSNQCKEGSNSSLFDFLDDSNRSNFKIVAPDATKGEDNKGTIER